MDALLLAAFGPDTTVSTVGETRNKENDQLEFTFQRSLNISSQNLFNDALHLVYSFLTATDFRVCMPFRTCRQWYAAAQKLKPYGWTYTCTADRMLNRMISSPLHYHFTTIHLGLVHQRNNVKERQSLLQLVTKMKWATRAYLEFRKDEQERNVKLSLTPISQLRYLTSLTIDSLEMCRGQVDLIRGMANLRTLCLLKSEAVRYKPTAEVMDGWTTGSFDYMFREGCKLKQLTNVNVWNVPLTIERMEMLIQLSELTIFRPEVAMMHQIPHLTKFPQLRELELQFRVGVCITVELFEDLTPFANLRTLYLRNVVFDTEEQFARVCSSLTQVRKLTLRRFQSHSLEPLRLIPNLHTLRFHHTHFADLEFLRPLGSISTLRHFLIGGDVIDTQFGRAVMQLKRPCDWMPQLDSLEVDYRLVHDWPWAERF